MLCAPTQKTRSQTKRHPKNQTNSTYIHVPTARHRHSTSVPVILWMVSSSRSLSSWRIAICSSSGVIMPKVQRGSVRSLCDRWRKLGRGASSESPVREGLRERSDHRPMKWKARGQLLRAPLPEIDTLRHRIAFVSRTEIYCRPLGIRQDYHTIGAGGLLRCKEIHAYTQDMQSLWQSYPWVTAVDSALFQKAWSPGSRWSTGNSCSGKFDRISLANPFESIPGAAYPGDTVNHPPHSGSKG